MKFVTVQPGPEFSVLDVHRGWVEALRKAGHLVVDINLSERLEFYGRAINDPAIARNFPDPDLAAAMLASKGIEAACFEVKPDVLFMTSGFYIPPEVYKACHVNGITTVLLCTESPYEDDNQLKWAPWADVILLNDPTNLGRFRELNPRTYYFPHAYDPARHHPGEPSEDCLSEFAFVATGFPSRIEFMEAVDWSGIDALFAGNWQKLSPHSPLIEFMAHDLSQCLDNHNTVRVYQSTKASANLYRRENLLASNIDGWSMGPREVELAACGTFFLRDPRPEGDEVFPMLPTFTDPDDFGEKLRWWIEHDDAREKVTKLAQQAVEPYTFDNNVAKLLTLLDHGPSPRQAASAPSALRDGEEEAP